MVFEQIDCKGGEEMKNWRSTFHFIIALLFLALSVFNWASGNNIGEIICFNGAWACMIMSELAEIKDKIK